MLVDIEKLAKKYIPHPADYSQPNVSYRYYKVDNSKMLHSMSFKTIRELYCDIFHNYGFNINNIITRLYKIKAKNIQFNQYMPIYRSMHYKSDEGFIYKTITKKDDIDWYRFRSRYRKYTDYSELVENFVK